MDTNLIPFRIYHIKVPQSCVMKALRIILANEVRFFIRSVSDDEQFLSLTLSVNLTKQYQRNAIAEIEALSLVPA